ncbi:MAG TPA: Gfo/Idh/MocA family oxidoreductase [Chthoniobacter sp.]|jgi:predicted dehydrogenase
MKVGLIGLGAIGRVHFAYWRKSSVGQLVAVSDRDQPKLDGKWTGLEFNIGPQAQEDVDLSVFAQYSRAEDLLADPEIELVDICLPTRLHAPLAVAALRAGKHVFCEKPMSLTAADCAAMEEAAKSSNRHLMIGHCLRFWPQYVKAAELLRSGEYGRPLYAEMHRSSPAPIWSDGDWYMKREESGGVLDMHIHDVDVALWWFGRPQKIAATGYAPKGLPMIVDTAWTYEGGPAVQMHASWDRNGGSFRHAFRVVMEKGTLVHDLAVDPQALHLLAGGKSTVVPVGNDWAYEAELDYFAREVAAGRSPQRSTPAESRLAVELALEEMRQLGA